MPIFQPSFSFFICMNRRITLLSYTDPAGVITFANDAFCDISKFTKEELIGKPHSVITHPDMPKRLFQILWSTIRRGEVFRGTIKNRAKDGSHYWVRATIMPVLDDNHNTIKYMCAGYLIDDDTLANDLFRQQLKLWGIDLA